MMAYHTQGPCAVTAGRLFPPHDIGVEPPLASLIFMANEEPLLLPLLSPPRGSELTFL
jgi:hypothetical protein